MKMKKRMNEEVTKVTNKSWQNWTTEWIITWMNECTNENWIKRLINKSKKISEYINKLIGK